MNQITFLDKFVRLYGFKNIADYETKITVSQFKETKKQETFRLGYFENLENTPYILIPLHSSEEIEKVYFSKGSNYNTRNYMLFDKNIKKGQWIFEDNKALLVGTTWLPRPTTALMLRYPLRLRRVGTPFSISRVDT